MIKIALSQIDTYQMEDVSKMKEIGKRNRQTSVLCA